MAINETTPPPPAVFRMSSIIWTSDLMSGNTGLNDVPFTCKNLQTSILFHFFPTFPPSPHTPHTFLPRRFYLPFYSRPSKPKKKKKIPTSRTKDLEKMGIIPAVKTAISHFPNAIELRKLRVCIETKIFNC